MEKEMNSGVNNMMNCPTVLTGISHEMRTHMNAIVAFSFLMKDSGCKDLDREEFSKQIFSSCEQLMSLLDSFLDSAIIDTGKSGTDPKSFRFDNLLDDLFVELREELDKDSHRELELITEIQYENSVEIIIDQNKIYRAIKSLFHNSLRTTKTGYIKIGYFLSDDKVSFYVKDSGQGFFKCNEFLHSEDLNKSLSLHNDTCTAINMTLAKKIIKMMGGTVSAECNGLTGTGIYFSIPVRLMVSSDLNINRYVNSMIAI